MNRKSFIGICFTALFMMLMAVSNKAMALEENGAWIQEEIEDTSKEWTIGFSKELGYDAMASGKISLNDENGRGLEVYLKLSDDKKSVKLIPGRAYEAGKTYCIKVASDLSFADASLLGKEINIPFRVSKVVEESKGVGYIVDSYYQGSDTYVEIDMGGMEKSKLKVASTDAKVKDECIVQYSVNSDGSVDIKMDDFDGYKLYKAEVVKKDGSYIKLKGESGVFELKSDAIVYEEDNQKSKSSIYKGQKVEILANADKVYVVKITGDNENIKKVEKDVDKKEEAKEVEKKSEELETDSKVYRGYLVDTFKKNGENYATIDNGEKKDYRIAGGSGYSDESIVSFTKNRNGSIDIQDNGAENYEVYKGEVLNKNGKSIELRVNNEKMDLRLVGDLVCYEEDNEKSRDSIVEHQIIEVLVKRKRIYVAKIIGENKNYKDSEQDATDTSKTRLDDAEDMDKSNTYIGHVTDRFRAGRDGKIFVVMDFQAADRNKKENKWIEVDENSEAITRYTLVVFRVNQDNKLEMLDKNPRGVEMYAGEILGVKGDDIIYTDGNKEYTFKFTDETVCYRETGEENTLGMIEENTLARVYVKDGVIKVMKLY